jgi:7-cyano-7-deazaguanine reductase
MYILFYRNLGIFHENVVNKIMEDFIKASRPRWVKITAEFNPRGGITTTVAREYISEKKSISEKDSNSKK